ncbi:MAG: hypothetical protein D8B59_02460 [Bacteroidetes bacterium]|nr:MAG: hypothetical protein D8B59_02460 [Bacteroidota bacterium]
MESNNNNNNNVKVSVLSFIQKTTVYFVIFLLGFTLFSLYSDSLSNTILTRSYVFSLLGEKAIVSLLIALVLTYVHFKLGFFIKRSDSTAS